mmetsp:Transcript_89180/g.237019  ORF Transcript_89180/g.237019 Transcript_89180/m.237019 type:complete len:287 (-) Transcript_89180:83-943(-)
MGASVGRSLGLVALADAAVQFACFAVAAALQTEKFYDVSASLTYILCVLLSLRRGPAGPRQKVNSGLVVLWATRLGSFLLWRIIQDGRDRRFDNVRNRPRRFFVYWAIQAFWILVTALPVYIVNSKTSAKSDQKGGKATVALAEEGQQASPQLAPSRALGWRDAVGWSAWAVGFIVQVVADYQKTAFRADPRNSGHWIDVGLWRLAQHPNYFGEISMWWGIFLSCSSELQGVELASGISPFFVTYLLLRVSGVPLLRRSGLKRWGHLPEYREYLQKTPLLVPLPRG